MKSGLFYGCLLLALIVGTAEAENTPCNKKACGGLERHYLKENVMEMKTKFNIGQKFWLLNEFYYERYGGAPELLYSWSSGRELTHWGVIGEVTIIGIKPEISINLYKEILVIEIETKLGTKTYHNFKRFKDLFPTKEEAEAECKRRN